MKLSVHVRSGSLAGRTFEFTEGPVRVGRRSELELALDPQRDLSVSALHAEFVQTPDGWRIRDLGSRNGTLVRGTPITKPTPIGQGTRIRFGSDGPEVEAWSGDPPPVGATARIQVAVRRETRRLRVGLALVAVALVALSATFLVRAHLSEAAWEAERQALLQAADLALEDHQPHSPSAAGADSESGDGEDLQGLSDALAEARAEVVALRRQIERMEAGSSRPGTDDAALRGRLRDATESLERRRAAGELNFPAIREANGMAVALVYVEQVGGAVVTGSAFAVRPDGLLLTVRHLVLPDQAGPPPSRIGVQFANSPQVFPARLVATSTEDDLAAIRVERLVGEVPVVRGFNTRLDTLGAGAGVAILGFPGGGDWPAQAEGQAAVVRPLLSAGILNRIAPERLELQGYGEPGASGSPVFDGDGKVVGVLFGGREGITDPALLAVSGARAARFLGRIP